MKTKIYIITGLFTFITLSVMAQTKNFSQKVQKIENTLYLVNNKEKFKVIRDVITVKLKPSEKELGKGIQVIRANRLGYIDIRVPKGIAVEEYVNTLKHSDKFECVEFKGETKCCFTPNDIHYDNQWYINTINLANAWNITTGDSTVKVAIIDTGVEASHNDLGSYTHDGYSQIDIANGINYTTEYNTHISPVYFHGTFVAGIIGAKTNNSIGISGVAGGNHSKGITIIPYCVGNSHTFNTAFIDDAIIDAIDKGVKVINISLSTPYSSDIAAAIEEAYRNNVTIVCSSGNYYPYDVSFPASYDKTIAVGAINSDNYRASFSHYGTGLDLVAPGTGIYSTTIGNDYDTSQGTSFAAPQVTGVIALMLSKNPNLSPNQIKNILQATCTKLPSYSYNNGWNEEVGYGVLNAYDAVSAAMDHEISGPDYIFTNGTFSIANLPIGASTEWNLLHNNYYTQYCLQQNSPEPNKCTITRDAYQDMINATLTAAIKYNGVTVQTLVKPGVYAYKDFYGKYTCDTIVGKIDYTHVFNVRPVFNTAITSFNLIGATVSYGSNGTTPLYFRHDPQLGKLEFTMPTNNGGAPVIINVNDIYGGHYQLYAMPINSYYLGITYRDGYINVTLENDEEKALKTMAIEQPWSYEIRSASMGALKASKSINTRSTTISTAGWPKGVYIIKAKIGKEEVTEKIVVK